MRPESFGVGKLRRSSTTDYWKTKGNYNCQLTIGAVDIVDKPLKKEEADEIIESVADLMGDPKFRKWYYMKLYDLGEDKFRELEALARQGTYPSRRFSSLLKRAKR
jgi:hypothetical protein